MKFTLYILVALACAFAAALPKDDSEYQHLSLERKMERVDIEEILKEACKGGKWACEAACLVQPEVCPLCATCNFI